MCIEIAMPSDPTLPIHAATLSLLDKPPPPSTSASTSEIQIRSVWDDNIEAEFALIAGFVADHPYATMDTEFPGVVYHPYCHPRRLSPEDRYYFLRSNVNDLNIIQFGLTLSDANGRLPRVNGRPVVWEFNFSDFDLSRGDLHAAESIALLQSHGIDFEVNRCRGIESSRFGELFISSGLVCNDSNVSWFAFHSAYDFGYIIKILAGGLLPESIDDFLELLRAYFGDRVFDMKHFMRRFDGLYGGLERVAETLNIRRVAGESHQAGSDSLLTWHTFLEMKKVYSLKDFEEEEHAAGIIFGLDEC